MFHHIMCEEEVAAPESASDLYAEVGVTESERSSVSELGVFSWFCSAFTSGDHAE